MSRRQKTLLALRYMVIIFMAFVMLIPPVWMVLSSMKKPVDVHKIPIIWLPTEINFKNYEALFTTFEAGRYVWNTIKFTALNLLGTLVSCSLVAYAMAFLKGRFKKVVMTLMLSTMMLPGAVTFFPQFILYVKLGMYGTTLPLWLPSFFGNSFYIILLRQYFLTIPQPIIDAARVSGCGHLRMLTKVIIPLAKPVYLMMILNTFVACWTDYFTPLIYCLKESDKTFALLLTYINDSWGNKSTLPAILAGGVIQMVPTLIVYLISQKNMVKAYAFKTGENS